MFIGDKYERAQKQRIESIKAFLQRVPSMSDPAEAGQQFSWWVAQADLSYNQTLVLLSEGAKEFGKRLSSVAQVSTFVAQPQPKSKHESGHFLWWYQIINDVAYGYLEAHDIATMEEGIQLCGYMRQNHWSTQCAHYEGVLIRKMLPLLSTKDAVLRLGCELSTFKGLMLLHIAANGDPSKALEEAGKRAAEDTAAEEAARQQAFM